MRIEFLTSFADGPFDYVEGTVRDVPDPLPPLFLGYLQRGLIKPVKDDSAEMTLDPAAVEHAIARRRRRTPTRQRKPVADECP